MRLLVAAIFLCLFNVPAVAVSDGKEFLRAPSASVAVKKPKRAVVARRSAKPHQWGGTLQGYAAQLPKGNVSLSGVVEPLAAKAREAVRLCGSKVVSAVRPGARIPTGRVSNHALGRAVDLQGNPSCIRSLFAGWPGGMSTDYGSAPGGPHYHVSYNPGGMEWGRRFTHYSSRRKAKHVRYAGAR